jgi:hypothetical protein
MAIRRLDDKSIRPGSGPIDALIEVGNLAATEDL